ncbi:DivIVA domain-containing protein [Luteococcus japonicus]|uniref:DivIVA domain-containing protein n=2 Tax=Luteococcus japonicus TaxID=33984 RepID=A0A1R4KH02_9ACTN|nr:MULTISPECIES: DivIVA domain-containing protein [Luteococcus]MDN5563401.1 DivIVA domain-containing protein [Luteococcus sp.]ROR55485.1 DivIVA domain-containing protein [Luteococcus japonicus]SJN43477.1 hypothetical protein FM114_14355 [Luteococcus japonicus LSP_Lj1]
MTWLLASLVLVVLAAAAVVGSGRWGAMPDLVDDRTSGRLPEGPIGARELLATRFTVVPRGYSMAEVDELLQRLAAQLPQDTRQADDKGGEDFTRASDDEASTPRRTTGRGLFEA